MNSKTITGKVKSWFSREIRNLVNDSNEAYGRWKRWRTPETEEILNNYRPKANYEIRAAKFKFYEDKFSTSLSSSLLTNGQSSFRLKCSCASALVDVVEDLKSKMDQNMVFSVTNSNAFFLLWSL